MKTLKFEAIYRLFIQLIALCLFVLFAAVSSAGSDAMSPFPLPEEGYERVVIELPSLVNEDLHKLEILIGKTMDIDCNQHWLSGKLERETVSGWGYSYFVLIDAGGPAASTLMACPPDEERREAFVKVRGDGQLLRYNSRMPVVLYVPTGFEVRYRIWTTQEETQRAIAM